MFFGFGLEEWIAVVLRGVLALVVGVILHESGHALMYRWLAGRWFRFSFSFKRMAIQCGVPEDYYRLDQSQKLLIVYAGVFLGALPLLWFARTSELAVYTSPVLVVLYFLGCKHDVRLAARIMKKWDWKDEETV